MIIFYLFQVISASTDTETESSTIGSIEDEFEIDFDSEMNWDTDGNVLLQFLRE